MAPALFKCLEDGSEQAAKEEDLFQYQRYRWLSNESEKLAARYRKFDLKALVNIAENLKGDSRRSCTKILKCVEGQFNKVFILTMDDGDEVVAKLPNPNAGPAFYTLSSEVATRDFLRSMLGVPIPHIYAWSSDAKNPVGAEYILEEKANGLQLGSIWYDWPEDSKLDLVNQIQKIEEKLESVSFSVHGSIYYKSDLESKSVLYAPLDSNIAQLDDHLNQETVTSPVNNFAVGPSTDPKLWMAERANINLSRGPWANPSDYARDIGMNELQWNKSYSQPRMNFHRSMQYPETPGDYNSLIKRYLTLAPYLVSAFSDSAHIGTLTHPDLHLDNIFVDPSTKRISSIIDWQSTTIMPMFLQRLYPQFLEPLSESSQSKEIPLMHYRQLARKKNPFRASMINDPLHSTKIKPIQLVPSCWERDDLFSLRNSLISVIAHWNEIVPDATNSCPISFSEEELVLHQDEMELIEGLSSIMHQLQDEATIPLGGMVRPDDYERLKELNRRFMQDFVDLGENPQQKALHAKVWPYVDS